MALDLAIYYLANAFQLLKEIEPFQGNNLKSKITLYNIHTKYLSVQ